MDKVCLDLIHDRLLKPTRVVGVCPSSLTFVLVTHTRVQESLREPMPTLALSFRSLLSASAAASQAQLHEDLVLWVVVLLYLAQIVLVPLSHLLGRVLELVGHVLGGFGKGRRVLAVGGHGREAAGMSAVRWAGEDSSAAGKGGHGDAGHGDPGQGHGDGAK